MKTVFVVDDNDVNLLTAEQALEEQFDVYTLPSAAAMFELLEDILPHVILLDIVMSEMDGFQAIEILKLVERYKNIPVIFLTGHADAETKAKGFKLGAVDFIHKPFLPFDLIERIERVIKVD